MGYKDLYLLGTVWQLYKNASIDSPYDSMIIFLHCISLLRLPTTTERLKQQKFFFGVLKAILLTSICSVSLVFPVSFLLDLEVATFSYFLSYSFHCALMSGVSLSI